jgi:MFS transporter, AAHS family, 4-hydroxybenzoate transporter
METTLNTARAVNASMPVGERRLSRFQAFALVLCGLCAVVDGFDVQVIGYVAPAVIRDWHIPPPAFGPVFSAGLLGLVLGSLILSMLADRIGRRPTLIVTTAALFVCCTLTGFSRTLHELMLLRFATGVALGSILPNAMALAGEYSPVRKRVSVMMLVSVGFTAGAVLSGFLCTIILPIYGWRGVFYVGGVAPLVISLLMVGFLPESVQYLQARGKHEAARRWIHRIDETRSGEYSEASFTTEQSSGKVSVSDLFKEGRARTTLMLWLANILNLVTLLFLSNWLPTLMVSLHTTQAAAVWAGTLLQMGGAIGSIAMGPVIDRYGFRPVMTPGFFVAACALLAFGSHELGLPAMLFATFIAGFGILGGQSSLNALAAACYPPGIRATGIGMALGVGRFSSICAPLLASEAIRLGFSSHTILACGAVPAFLCAAIVIAMKIQSRPATGL